MPGVLQEICFGDTPPDKGRFLCREAIASVQLVRLGSEKRTEPVVSFGTLDICVRLDERSPSVCYCGTHKISAEVISKQLGLPNVEGRTLRLWGTGIWRTHQNGEL